MHMSEAHENAVYWCFSQTTWKCQRLYGFNDRKTCWNTEQTVHNIVLLAVSDKNVENSKFKPSSSQKLLNLSIPEKYSRWIYSLRSCEMRNFARIRSRVSFRLERGMSATGVYVIPLWALGRARSSKIRSTATNYTLVRQSMRSVTRMKKPSLGEGTYRISHYNRPLYLGIESI
jgi:hypothetical protein